MQENEVSAKGIVLSAAPQGEYGRRLSILTDRFGKITVFAQAAAKPGSRLTGLTLPMTCALFRLSRGKNAWNLHGAQRIASFPELSGNYARMLCGMYFLELLSYFSQEGMEETEARQLLNLSYCALSALSGGRYSGELSEAAAVSLLQRMFELRLLVTEGEYTELPPHPASKPAERLWRHTVGARLSLLFPEALSDVFGEGGTLSESERKEAAAAFCSEVRALFHRMVPYKFKSAEVLREEIE